MPSRRVTKKDIIRRIKNKKSTSEQVLIFADAEVTRGRICSAFQGFRHGSGRAMWRTPIPRSKALGRSSIRSTSHQQNKKHHRDWWCKCGRICSALQGFRHGSGRAMWRTPIPRSKALGRSSIRSTSHQQKQKTPPRLVVFFVGDPWENRTPVSALRGPCLSRLTNGPSLDC